MIQYRKNSDRQLYKVNESEVIKVTLKFAYVSIQIYNSALMREDVLTDYKPCTEEEFTSAYNLALERIKMMQI
jgi:hypothetical protein